MAGLGSPCWTSGRSWITDWAASTVSSCAAAIPRLGGRRRWARCSSHPPGRDRRQDLLDPPLLSNNFQPRLLVTGSDPAAETGCAAPNPPRGGRDAADPSLPSRDDERGRGQVEGLPGGGGTRRPT